MFPRIFYKKCNSAILGALPSIMFTEYGSRARKGGVASLSDHITIRMLNPAIPTSRDRYYITYAFDVLLNKCLMYNTAASCVKKGLESIVRSDVHFADRESMLDFSSMDSRVKVRELSSLMRTYGPWDLFFTITGNDTHTYGLKLLVDAIAREVGGDRQSKEFTNTMAFYIHILNRAWYRIIRFYMDYIRYSPELPFEHPVAHVWFRMEFQSDSSLGNRPHVHAGLVFVKPRPRDYRSVVVCEPNEFFDISRKTDYYGLLGLGWIEDHDEYIRLQEMADAYTHHNCHRKGSRCQKEDKNGKKVCRFFWYTRSHYYTFNEIIPYDLETLKTMERLGLAEMVPGYGIFPHRDLSAGVHNIPNWGVQRRVSTNPILFFHFRSVTNVRICDERFQVSYLVKYAAGKEQHDEVPLEPSTDNVKNVTQLTVPRHNEKISGESIRNAEKKREPALCREIGLSEASWFLLKLPYVGSTVEFVHASTKPPESRVTMRVNRKQRGSKSIINDNDQLIP